MRLFCENWSASRAGARELLDPVTNAIEKVLLEVSETRAVIYTALSRTRFAPSDLDEAEERLFALREAARKYKVPVVMLPELYDKIKGELAALDADEERSGGLAVRLSTRRRRTYVKKADESEQEAPESRHSVLTRQLKRSWGL